MAAACRRKADKAYTQVYTGEVGTGVGRGDGRAVQAGRAAVHTGEGRMGPPAGTALAGMADREGKAAAAETGMAEMSENLENSGISAGMADKAST